MSYILDALKKSEREKTLGQVPTLESVVSDGGKKQRTGTPWWLNVLVFIVALLAVVAILKMAGLFEFSRSGDTASVQTEQPQVQAVAEISTSDAATATTTQTSVDSGANQTQTTLEDEQATGSVQQSQDSDAQELATEELATEELQAEDLQTQDSQTLAQTQDEPPLPDQATDASANEVAMADTTAELEEKFAAQEEEEIAALAQELELQQNQAQQQSNQANSNNTDTNQQASQSDYEEVIHDGLRDISVNVVSYSSDSRQRFVMLDLTIYKEGDQLANSAEVIQIIRTGAIVEYQNKRYLLKP